MWNMDYGTWTIIWTMEQEIQSEELGLGMENGKEQMKNRKWKMKNGEW